jgi:hypothetical protein
MTDDVDLLVNEAKRICNSLDGRVSQDALRRQFAHALSKQDPRRRATHAVFNSAVERAKQYHQLRQDKDGNLWLRDQ